MKKEKRIWGVNIRIVRSFEQLYSVETLSWFFVIVVASFYKRPTKMLAHENLEYSEPAADVSVFMRIFEGVKCMNVERVGCT